MILNISPVFRRMINPLGNWV